MVANFTDEHVGKRVLSQSGNELGTVERVENGDLYVEVGPDADPDILDELNWAGTVNQEVHRLKDRHVGDITERTVRLSV